MSHLRIFNHYVSTPLLVLGAVELLVLLAAIPLACYLRFGSDYGQLEQSVIVTNTVIFSFVMVNANQAMGVYSHGFKDGLGVMAVRTVVANCLLGVVALTVLYYVLPQLYLGRGVLAISTVIGMALISPVRLAFYKILGRDSLRARMLILGAGERALALVEKLDEQARGLNIIGFVDLAGTALPELKGRLIERDKLKVLVERHQIDEVVVAMDGQRASDGAQIPLKELLECKQKGTRVSEAIGVYERELGILEFTELKQGWMVFSSGFGGSRTWDLIKRGSDLLIATMLLLLLWPLMLLAALVIFLETGSPILYRQRRVGLNGHIFEILKFRSMTTDAEAGGAQFAQAGDSRVTRVGGFLRNTRIDELPQLYNVFRGDMSFVGPRPERPEFVDGFCDELPFYGERHTVKPGLMGWAQLNYPYGASVEDAANKLRYDLYYVKNRSLVLDIVIMIQTVQIILLGSGVR